MPGTPKKPIAKKEKSTNTCGPQRGGFLFEAKPDWAARVFIDFQAQEMIQQSHRVDSGGGRRCFESFLEFFLEFLLFR